jgi:hypothetical protein
MRAGLSAIFPGGCSAMLMVDASGVHRYDLAEQTWRDRLCRLVGRDLTAAE